MVDLLHWGAVVAAVSALPLVLVGLLLLLVRPRRTSTLAFATFLILWGALILFGNGARLILLDGDIRTARTLILLFVAITIILYLPLAYFASVYPAHRAFFARRPLGQSLLLAPAAIGAVAFAYDPTLYFVGFTETNGDPRSTWGPLFPVYGALLIAAFLYAAITLYRHQARTTRRIERRRTLFVLLALVVYLAFWAGEGLMLYGALALRSALPAQDVAFAASAVVAAACLAWTLVGVMRDPDWRRDPGRPLLVAAHAVPFAFGILSGLSALLLTIPAVPTHGVWRIIAAALLAYAILRWQLFDLDRRVKTGALAAGLVLGVIGATVALELLLARVLNSTGIALAVTQALVVGALVLVLFLLPGTVRRLSTHVLPGLDASWRLDKRRLEVYEAALVQALAERPRDPHALTALRAQLGIGPNEGAVLERLVRGDLGDERAEAKRGTLVAGRYRLEERLGEGVFGSAWLAHDNTLDRRVVLKVRHRGLGEDGLREFLREARTAARLEHPHVVRVYDFGYLGGAPFIVTEFCEGGSLADVLAREEPVDPEVAATILQDVLDGLACIHRRGIVHRDLKPANILFGRDGVAKIADFGLAVGLDPQATQIGLDDPAVVGTPAYMSPEAALGLSATPSGDVYSAGAILYHLLTGQTYLDLENRDAFAIRAAIIGDRPRRPEPPLPAPWWDVVSRALDKDPSRRYLDAESLQEAVADAAAGVSSRLDDRTNGAPGLSPGARPARA